MANENWQSPLVEVADPFKLKKWAEDTGEVEIADKVFGIAECNNLLESYLMLLNVLEVWDKMKEEQGRVQTLKSQGVSALENHSENGDLFGLAADKCRALNTSQGVVAKKKQAYGHCQTHLNNWKGAFKEGGAKLAAAILVDRELYKERGPMSVGAAIKRVRSGGGAWPEGLEEVVRWYLETIRVKYRKDFELKKEEVRCEGCGNMKGEGEPCPTCIGKAEEKIRKALAEGEGGIEKARERLKEAKEVPGFDAAKWEQAIREKEGEQARRKREEAERAAAAAVRAIEEAIADALAKSPPDLAEAERKLEEGKTKSGFREEDWRGKIEGAKKKKEFDKALLEARWADAEGMVGELVRLKVGTREGLKGQIDKKKQRHQEDLEEKCTARLDEAERALGEWEKTGDSEGAAAVISRIGEALQGAKEAGKILEGKYSRSGKLSEIKKRIGGIEKRLKAAEAEQEVRSLCPATEVKAQGSADGAPVVTVTWKGAEAGGATGWRVLRREKGKREVTVVASSVTGTGFRDSGNGLQLGVWYEYGVVPVLGTRVGSEKVQCWTRPEEAAGCTAKLAPGALSGKGEGVEGGWASVSLEWTLPAGLGRGCKNMELTLQRSGGGSVVADEPVAERLGRWEDDRKIRVGGEYEYTLQLKLFGKPMGSSRVRVAVKKLQPPSGVSGLRLGRSATGKLEAQWDWPVDVESCIWGTAVREPRQIADLPKTRCYRLRRPMNGRSVVTLPESGGGEQWLAVFGVRGKDEHVMASPPVMLCISKTTLGYHVEGGGLFGRKKPQLVLESSTGAYPELEIRVGTLVEVLGREGRVLGNPQWTASERQPNGGWKKSCPLDGVRKHEHVRVFLVHPDRENCEMASVQANQCEVR